MIFDCLRYCHVSTVSRAVVVRKTLTVTGKTIVESNQETINNKTWNISPADNETVQHPVRFA